MALPSYRERAQYEAIWFEYDAYAKLENSITFITTDLDVIQDYVSTATGPLLPAIIKQFAQDLIELKLDAEDLQKGFNFPLGIKTAMMIWREIDTLSHRSIGELIIAKDYGHLSKALQSMAKASTKSSGPFFVWKVAGRDGADGLHFLSTHVLEKLNSLLGKLNQA